MPHRDVLKHFAALLRTQFGIGNAPSNWVEFQIILSKASRRSDGDRFSPKAFKLSVLLRATRLGIAGQPFARTEHCQCRHQEFVPPGGVNVPDDSALCVAQVFPVLFRTHAMRAKQGCHAFTLRFPWAADAEAVLGALAR